MNAQEVPFNMPKLAAMQTPRRELPRMEVPNAPKKQKKIAKLPAHRLVVARDLMRAFMEAQDEDSVEDESKESS